MEFLLQTQSTVGKIPPVHEAFSNFKKKNVLGFLVALKKCTGKGQPTLVPNLNVQFHQ